MDERHFNEWIFGKIIFECGISEIVDLTTTSDELYSESIHIMLPENNPHNKTIASTYQTINFEEN